MNPEFPSILSGLRKAKGVSQRQAAENLQVSQALLSHYENGIREPGFDFLIRVGEYYGISIDYLLGRTKVKQNPFLTGHMMPKNVSDLSDELLAKLNDSSRLLLNSIALTLTLLCRTSGGKGIDCATDYFKSSIYHIFRLMKLYLGENGFENIKLPIGEVAPGCSALENKSIAELVHHLLSIAGQNNSENNTYLHFTEDIMSHRFTNTFDSFKEVIYEIDSRLYSLYDSDLG